MFKTLLLTTILLLPGLAWAQTAPSGTMKIQGGQMDHTMHANQMGTATGAAAANGLPLSEPGQSAFAAIAEVVAALEADPDTDWESVNIDALRDHLRDMSLVTINSTTVNDPIEGGMRFVVTGDSSVAPSIRRMVMAHAAIMDGTDGWAYGARETEDGAILEVTPPEAELPRLRALGFYGLLASGMHHQPHHWMMATGANPHQ